MSAPFRLLGCFLEKFPVSPKKGRVILKSTQIADLGDGGLGFQKIPGHAKTFTINIISDGLAGFFFKEPHQMIFADKKLTGEKVHS